jgi:hypothetical protein
MSDPRTPITNSIVSIINDEGSYDPDFFLEVIKPIIAKLEEDFIETSSDLDFRRGLYALQSKRMRELEEEVKLLREGFNSEGLTSTESCCEEFKKEQAETIKSLEEELEEIKNKSKLSSINRQLQVKLNAERELADRLAISLEILARLDGPDETNESEKAIKAWKEARKENLFRKNNKNPAE